MMPAAGKGKNKQKTQPKTKTKPTRPGPCISFNFSGLLFSLVQNQSNVGCRDGSSGSVCLAGMKPWVQVPIPLLPAPPNYSTGSLKFKIVWFPWTAKEAEREKG
jgi:hypothetical protein